MIETWKDIKGFGGRYQLSNCNRVKSVRRTVKNNRGGTRIVEECYLKPTITKGGNLRYTFSKDNRRIRQILSKLKT